MKNNLLFKTKQIRLPLSIPYKQINKLAEQETFESTFTWGLRMSIAATAPIIWGAATNRIPEAVWISLTAEGISFMELRGSFNQGLRVLVAGAILAFIFTALGSITGVSMLLSVTGMLLVGFIAGLFKNLGDRGSSLAVAAFVLFIVCNAYPTHNFKELQSRMLLVSAGGIWAFLVGMVVTVIMPVQEPYRRTVGLIWKAIAELVIIISNGWDGKTLRSSVRDIYLAEKKVRAALDSSLHYYESTSQSDTDEIQEVQLMQIRKATAIVAAHINAIAEELETIAIKDIDTGLRIKLHDVLKGLQQLSERMAVFIITLRSEDELLYKSRLSKLQQLITTLREHNTTAEEKAASSISRICQLAERSLKLTDSITAQLEEMGKDLPVFRSYSLYKTLFILHPRHWIRNLQLLFNFNTFTTRYALRTAVAAAVAMFISKWFNVDHGYWLPFTVLIVSQPYFGATFKKAIDRITGTILGGIAGGLLLHAHVGLWIEISILFISFILMIYFLRNRYSVGAFFITVALILLFNIERPISDTLIYTRAFSTIGGAAIAIIAGFILLPHRDRKSLPLFIAKAINYNYEYFLNTFFSEGIAANWTRYKRIAESNNSNAFDSFTRYIQEPGIRKKHYSNYYQVITHNVRVTRELNNINIERENSTEAGFQPDISRDKRTEICIYWFKQNLALVQQLAPAQKLFKRLEVPVSQSIHLSQEQIVYIDRMILELKSMNQDLTKLKPSDNEAVNRSLAI